VNPRPLITGPAVGPSQIAQLQPARRRIGLLHVIVIGWLLAGLAAAVFYFVSRQHEPTRIAAPPDSAEVARAEEAIQRLEALIAKTATDAANLRRVENQISLSLPVIDQNGLAVERRRLENATVMVEAARRDLERIRQEAEDTLNSLKKEKQQ
jgi:flagellar basal body-associated protein FliL